MSLKNKINKIAKWISRFERLGVKEEVKILLEFIYKCNEEKNDVDKIKKRISLIVKKYDNFYKDLNKID